MRCGLLVRALEDEMTFDECAEGREWQAKGIDIEASLVRCIRSRKGKERQSSSPAIETDVQDNAEDESTGILKSPVPIVNDAV